MISKETTVSPRGSNADEWRLFLSGYVDSRATSIDGMSFVAVQIAEAIEAERERCAAIVRRFRLDEHADIMLQEIESGG